MSGVDRDVLLSRVLDGEASPEDWQAFKALAARDQSVWHELAEAQQDLAELGHAVSEAVAIADSIDLPIEEHLGEGLAVRARRLATWGGWLAAAVVALAAMLGNPNSSPVAGAQQAGLLTGLSPDEALRAYFDKGREEGRVVGEMPERVVVQAEPTDEGRYEVLYIRQIVERAIVDDLYRFGADELGQAVPIRVEPPVRMHGAF